MLFLWGFAIIVVLLAVFTLWSMLNKNWKVKVECDKSIVYLFSEISYSDSGWEKISLKLDNIHNTSTVNVPFNAIWKGIFIPHYERIHKAYFILSGITSLFFIAYLRSIIVMHYYDIFWVMLVIPVALTAFLYNFKTVSSLIDNEQSKIYFVANKLNSQYNLDKFDSRIVEKIKEEIEIDFNLYGKDNGSKAIMTTLLLPFIAIYSRISENLDQEMAAIFISTVVPILLMNWLFKNYRARILYIALNSIITVQKRALVNTIKQVTQ